MPPAKSGSAPTTFKDGLSDLLHDIADCMSAPDADMAFCYKLQQAVLLKLHGSNGQQQGQAPGGAPGGPGAPSPAGAPPGMGMPGGGPGGGAANGQMQSQGAPVTPAGASPTGGVTKPLFDPEAMRRELAEQASA